MTLFGLLALPGSVAADPVCAAEVRLGRKVARTVGLADAGRLVRTLGPQVAMLDAEALQARCADDFRNGRTLVVGGALVARTEAVRWLLAAGFDPA